MVLQQHRTLQNSTNSTNTPLIVCWDGEI